MTAGELRYMLDEAHEHLESLENFLRDGEKYYPAPHRERGKWQAARARCGAIRRLLDKIEKGN